MNLKTSNDIFYIIYMKSSVCMYIHLFDITLRACASFVLSKLSRPSQSIFCSNGNALC